MSNYCIRLVSGLPDSTAEMDVFVIEEYNGYEYEEPAFIISLVFKLSFKIWSVNPLTFLLSEYLEVCFDYSAKIFLKLVEVCARGIRYFLFGVVGSHDSSTSIDLEGTLIN